jgi:bis(5'-nucleosidyl)-tetraphosphatase
MKEEFTAGGIVLGDHGTIAMVKHTLGTGLWFFPKGHLDEGETDEEAARREISEETGISELEYIDDLGSYRRLPIKIDGSEDTTICKNIHMYLFAAKTDATLKPTLEIEEARWVPYRLVADEIGNAKDKAWFATVFPRIREAIQRD